MLRLAPSLWVCPSPGFGFLLLGTVSGQRWCPWAVASRLAPWALPEGTVLLPAPC